MYMLTQNCVKNGEIANGEKINVVVPTGNFGNILAAFYAKTDGTADRKTDLRFQ